MESLQKEFAYNAKTNHSIIGIMRAVYFLAKNNLSLRLLPSIVELIKDQIYQIFLMVRLYIQIIF